MRRIDTDALIEKFSASLQFNEKGGVNDERMD